MLLYIIMLIVGVIVGAGAVTASNIITKKNEEKQYLDEYKEIIEECLYHEEKNKDIKKKESSKN